jgi:colicin import membrane protein
VAPKIPDKQADAQIAIEKEKKARAEKEKIEKARLEKVAKEKADKEKADREKLEKDKLAREKAQKAEKAEKAEAQKRAAAEEARVAQMREENLKRMMGQIGPAGSTGTGGTATKEASYSSSYEGKIRAAIKTNLIFNRSFTGNPKVIVEIRVGPSGTIISQRIKTRSGNPDWDEAVVRAVERTGTLPRDVDGRVPDLLEVTYGPADLMRN